jgi:pyridinium-3,5-biscarboxylic acid mononucleotide synthase
MAGNMDQLALKKLLGQVQAGEVTIEAALGRLRHLPFESLGFAHIDHHRSLRCGFPEVIFCQSKTVPQVEAIFERLAGAGSNVLATRATAEMFERVRAKHPKAEYHEAARAITLRQKSHKRRAAPRIGVVTAGTADIPVAEEARVTCEIMDQPVRAFYDVGVAGLHRLLAHYQALQGMKVLVVAAGMEGALASVIGGLVNCPVIAVPTSVGYGASFGGLAALLTMLNSCAAGVSVVNIDNGFAAGYQAAVIAGQCSGKNVR